MDRDGKSKCQGEKKKNWKKISLSFQFFLVKRKNYNLSFFFSRLFFSGLETHTSIRPLKTNGDQRHNLVFVKKRPDFPSF
jgi:hypothetical protein